MFGCGGETAVEAEHGDLEPALPSVGTIFTIVLENQDYADIVGSAHAPYLNSLIQKYGLATNYSDSGVHPSLPNYLTMISGAPQYPGHEDLDPTHAPFPLAAPNLGDQMQTAGIKWRSYQESMARPCRLAASGTYAPKHDPFLYFTSIQNTADVCTSTNVDYSSFDADLASGAYRYMWITPNLTDDGHNPTQQPVKGLEDADAWAASEIPKIMASAAYARGGVIFLTWDEAEGRNGNAPDQIPMIVISSRIVHPGFTSAKPYSHRSYLATVEDMLGLPRLATVTNEPTLGEFLR
jgi:acid phosphatase